MSQQERREMDTVLQLPATDDSFNPDKLPWRDKLPLTLALVAQSYVVFLWYLRSTHGVHPYVDFLIALAAGIALDWLTVSTVMGRREGRTSIWSWLTSFGTFVGSAMIAYDTYAAQWWPIDGQALLHVCFPLVVLLYSLHLAAPRQPKEAQALSIHSTTLTALPEHSSGLREAVSIEDAPIATLAASSASYACPACSGQLVSIGELGAAKRWGHCRHCKGRMTVPLAYPVEQTQNGATSE